LPVFLGAVRAEGFAGDSEVLAILADPQLFAVLA
jgi:hypothetical protein